MESVATVRKTLQNFNLNGTHNGASWMQRVH